MGSDGRFPYPKDVWSPGGGWWPHPKAWRGNSIAAGLLIFGLCIPVFMVSEKKMVRHHTAQFPPSRRDALRFSPFLRSDPPCSCVPSYPSSPHSPLAFFFVFRLHSNEQGAARKPEPQGAVEARPPATRGVRRPFRPAAILRAVAQRCDCAWAMHCPLASACVSRQLVPYVKVIRRSCQTCDDASDAPLLSLMLDPHERRAKESRTPCNSRVS